MRGCNMPEVLRKRVNIRQFCLIPMRRGARIVGTLILIVASGCHSSAGRHDIADAASRGDTAGVLGLIKSGVSPNSHWDEHGTPILAYAIDSGHIETVDVLLDHGAKVDERTTET